MTRTAAGGAGAGAHALPAGRSPGDSSLRLRGPGVVAADADGNVYAAVRDGVFRIDAAGMRTRVAGIGGEWRYSGDGGPAILAHLNARAVALDASRNLYVADAGNNRIRRVDAVTGVITTVAGNGDRGFSGDGGPAVNARLDGPAGVAVDAAGNIYIADGITDGNDRIRRVDAATGVIATVAGNGAQSYAGDGGPATLAQFRSLGGLAADASGNLYIADSFNNRIRMVSAATGIITTVAGTGVAGGAGDGGPAANAQLDNPLSVTLDGAGNLYIADSGNFRIRKVSTATGTIATLAGSGPAVYPDTQHGYPCALVVDAAGDIYVADSGTSRVRRVPADMAGRNADAAEVAATPALRSFLSAAGFTINVTYDSSVPAAAQAAFNTLVSAYEATFTGNVTVNVEVAFGNTGLGASETEFAIAPYSQWRAAMIANATANSGNSYAVAAAASLPVVDPIGNGTVFVTTANSRALGVNANVAVDTSMTLSNSVIYEYTGKAAAGEYDFMDVAAHELDEGLAIGSALTGLANNAALPTGFYEPEDYFRYSAPGTRDITTSPTAVVYFSHDDGNTNVAQFNQAYSALGDSNLDRNDWIYGNSGCPAATPHIQDALTCSDQAVPVGQAGSPEVIVLNALAFNSGTSLTPQSITSYFLGSGPYTFGSPPITVSATASSGLAVSFSSSTTAVCTVSGTTVIIVGVGTCTLTASQPGNSSYGPASVTQSFTVVAASQQITFATPPNVSLGVAPFVLSATANSGLPVSYSATPAAVCTVSGSTVTVTGAGSCTIVASQVGNADYTAAAPVMRSFLVSAGAGAPVINAGGIVPIYSSVTTIQPGSWISIFGSNLASASATWNSNFPTLLGGVSVTIDNKPAYLWYVSPTQINLQAPDDSATGNVSVTVANASGKWTSTVTLAPISPSFSLLDGKHVAGIILRSGGAYDIIGPTGTSLGYPTVAAKAGDIVELFGVGFGPTSPSVAAGQLYSGAAATTNAVQLKIGGTTVTPSFTGLSSAGLYQINLTIPPGPGTGDMSLTGLVGGLQTQAGVLISLQ